MTPQTQHCEHECVCKSNEFNGNTPCSGRVYVPFLPYGTLDKPKKCEHDTRFRPLSDEKPCDHCDFNERDLQIAEAIMKAKKAERERVLDEIMKHRSEISTHKCYEMSDLYDLLKLDEDAYIKSLRGEP